MIAPKRRTFRFSLRTLFVVVTFLACIAAWIVGEIRFASQRRTFGDAIMTKQGYFRWNIDHEVPEVWWGRVWLGDYSVDEIRVPVAHDAEFRSEAQRLFPEAVFNPISEEELEQDALDRDVQQKQEAEDATRIEHLKRGDWFLKDGSWTRLTPIPDDTKPSGPARPSTR